MKVNGRKGTITETRKVQVSGNSTYLITLPKWWVEKVQLKRSDSIALFPLSNGTLIINPINLKDSKLNRISDDQPVQTINIQGHEFEVLWRKFIGAYSVGYNIIRFHSNRTMSRTDRQMIKRISNSVMGSEIVSETGNSITVRDLLGKGGFSIEQGIRRMHLMAKGMHQDAVKALRTNDRDLMDDVVARDEEINKLYWIVAKQYNFISKDIYFADNMGITPQEALGYLQVARYIEKIADHATRISTNVKLIGQDHRLVSRIADLSDEIICIFDESMDAFFGGDFDFADQIVRKTARMDQKLKELSSEIMKLREDPCISIPLAYICDSLERALSYSKDIAEISINHQYAVRLSNRGDTLKGGDL